MDQTNISGISYKAEQVAETIDKMTSDMNGGAMEAFILFGLCAYKLADRLKADDPSVAVALLEINQIVEFYPWRAIHVEHENGLDVSTINKRPDLSSQTGTHCPPITPTDCAGEPSPDFEANAIVARLVERFDPQFVAETFEQLRKNLFAYFANKEEQARAAAKEYEARGAALSNYKERLKSVK